MTFSAAVKAKLLHSLGVSDSLFASSHHDPSAQQKSGGAELNDSLRLLAKWRSALIQNVVLQHQGTCVRQGVLKGLDFLPQSAEGCHVPKLLGCYEAPLQAHLQSAIARDYDIILNIGSAEGYYAAGLARAMPHTMIHAFDINAHARSATAKLAEKNSVGDRVALGGLFSPDDFERFSSCKTLVLCDIEGAEFELLDPDAAPALSRMDIIVEAHDCFRPGLSRTLEKRFAETHDVTRIDDDGQRSLIDPPEWFLALSHLDQLLAVWEWRSGPTPWLVMTARVS